VRSSGSVRQIATTTGNVVGYLATGGRHIPLEGGFRGRRFRNWSKVLGHTPDVIHRPSTDQAIEEVVGSPAPVRTVGSGHSFNTGFAGRTMLGLDRHTGVDIDTATMTARVKSGTRMRDLSRQLWKQGYALAALASHDAQSIGGLIATNVHGTGRTLDAFVSEQVLEMRIIDGQGNTHTVKPEDDLFRATVGGIGATGVITEATFAIVPRFNVEQRTAHRELAEVRREWSRLLEQHDHLGLYVFPFARRCQFNTWDRTDRRRSRWGTVREAISISRDALATSVVGNILAYSGLLPRLAERALGVQKLSHLVLRSYQAFNRSVYHQHEELEFAVAADVAFDALTELVELYHDTYKRGRLPFTVFEVRFTPGGHDRTFIGPGRGGPRVWIDVVCNETRGFDAFYRDAVVVMRKYDSQPHLGKWADTLSRDDLAAAHGPQFARFLELRKEFDPQRRFDNALTAQLFDT
jgi:FAD/FMN-containing dehydrogenase